MTHHRDKPANADTAICEAVYAAIEPVPVTAEQVRQAEQTLAGQTIPLSASLRDPQAVFDRPVSAPATIVFSTSGDIDATLARAAREAGHITSEIQERMHHDRQAAQEHEGR